MCIIFVTEDRRTKLEEDIKTFKHMYELVLDKIQLYKIKTNELASDIRNAEEECESILGCIYECESELRSL